MAHDTAQWRPDGSWRTQCRPMAHDTAKGLEHSQWPFKAFNNGLISLRAPSMRKSLIHP